MSRMTLSRDKKITPSKKNLSDLKLLEDEQENRRYWFARHCHKYGSTLAPSGISWDDVFEINEGITLREYIKFAKENKLGEKYVPNKSR